MPKSGIARVEATPVRSRGRAELAAAAEAAAADRVRAGDGLMARVARGRPKPPSTDDLSLYLNRELSWLEFNHRVLRAGRGRRTRRCSSGCVPSPSTRTTWTSSSWSASPACVDQLERRHGAEPTAGRPPRCCTRSRDRVRELEAELERTCTARCCRRWPRRASACSTLAECTPAERRRLDEMLRQRDLPGADAARGRTRATRSRTSRTCRSRSACSSSTPHRRAAVRAREGARGAAAVPGRSSAARATSPSRT